MATIKINDLQISKELDNNAQSKIRGGSRSGAYAGKGNMPAWSLINPEDPSGFKFLSPKRHGRRAMKS